MSTKSSIRTKSLRFILMVVILIMALVVAVTVSADGKAGSTNSGNAVGYTPITGSPLTINVAVDASYQVIHDGVDPGSPGQVFWTLEDEADAGIFLWYGNYVIGPDFDNHDTSASNSYDPWANVSQSAVTGSGTSADPWMIETAVEHAASGAAMTVDTVYVNGDDYFRMDWEVCVPTPGAASTFLAADYYLQGSDNGYGYYDADSGSVGGFNEAQDWFQIFTPITPASAYFEGHYGDVWDLIGYAATPGSGFNNTIVDTLVDNGAGLQWDYSADGCSQFQSFWSFGDTPVLPPTSVATSAFEGSGSQNYLLLAVAAVIVVGAGLLVLRLHLAKNR